jgi:hypothetical protein
VVVTQEFRPDYGNMIEIDHGKDLITRYAHASKTFVKKGDLIKRGQKIAAVGTTGRSTGPHLHFEVLVRGVPQNPQKFMSAASKLPAQQVALATRMPVPLPRPAPVIKVADPVPAVVVKSTTFPTPVRTNESAGVTQMPAQKASTEPVRLDVKAVASPPAVIVGRAAATEVATKAAPSPVPAAIVPPAQR